MKLTKKEFENLIREEVKKAIDEINLIDEAKKKTKPSAGLTKKQKSTVVKKAKKGEDIGKKGKAFKDVVAKAKEWGAKDPEAVAGAAMWKNIKRG